MPIHGYPGGVITANPVAPTSTVATGVWTTEQQLAAVAAGNWPLPGPPQPISRSLRFNSADLTYLSETFGTPTNNRIWTWSGWAKRSVLGSAVSGHLFSHYTSATANNYFYFTGDVLRFSFDNGTVYAIATSAVFRDPSAWYHVVIAVDTTQATAANRTKLYVNGVEQTVTGSYVPQNTNTYLNGSGRNVTIGRRSAAADQYFDGYLTEINFIDGQALTPSSFGQTNASTGVWEPLAYTGTYGTNGFYVNFSDNSNTTAATLGKDYSGNGNNWTPNNFSVTAGAGNDSLVDSPTSYGTDTGVGGEVRGNYCTWNPLAKGSSTTLSNGNLDVLGSTNSTGNNNFSTFIPSSEKWYFEASPANTYLYSYVGISLDGGLSVSSNFVGGSANSIGVELGSGAIWRNGSNQGTGGTGVSAGETLMVAFEPSSGKMWAGRNGTWYNSGNPAAGTGQVATIPTVGAIGPAISPYSSSGTISFNFGQRAFAYTAPSGFKALCTQNLPTPTIGATSTTQANDYMNVVLYTGNSSTQTISGVGFQPDLVWVKNRSSAGQHVLTDVLRGTDRQLFSSLTNAEQTSSTGLTAFTSDGFILGANPSPTGSMNGSPDTYVAWNWNAGGSTVTNTSGTISAQVRANTTSGFSVVSFTSTGSQGTVGHGLGIAPSMIIMKQRSSGSAWSVYHVSIGNTKRLVLNATDAEATDSVWGNTTPTSTVFTQNVSGSTPTAIAYCFAPVAGYSAFGSYTGNGSADGPFVYLGFRPEFVMIKRTNTTEDWMIWDASRSPYNAGILRLYPNTSGAENSTDLFDLLSNGFKCRDNDTVNNGSGSTYIYMAFAESPFKYSLAR